ncbi:MAG TPA: hypothetical protein VM076_11895 [Gemmatimonadaceae bacterium]|nr:hypothetical protein [Gemmatimonadaceae bacterium]
MLESTPLTAVGAIFALSVGHALWRRQRARDIAERWLAQNRYRVRSLRASFWDSPMRFRATPFRNNDWAVDFRAEVDDMRLGGTGKVRLRVWTDWLGMIDREPEISWVSMPTEENGGAQSPETQWAESQLAILRRVADGETTFRPDGREPAARLAFDDTVEHLMALQRRGLLTCSTPIAELKADAQYAAVTDIELTDEGRRVRANASAAPRATSTISE